MDLKHPAHTLRDGLLRRVQNFPEIKAQNTTRRLDGTLRKRKETNLPEGLSGEVANLLDVVRLAGEKNRQNLVPVAVTVAQLDHPAPSHLRKHKRGERLSLLT